MKHTLQISVSKKPKNDGIAAVRKVSVREKFLRFLFGDKTRLTVIVPGDTVPGTGDQGNRKGGSRETV